MIGLIGRLSLASLFAVCCSGSVGAVSVAPVTEETTYASRVVATALDRPQAVAPIGGDSALVAERSGHVVLVEGGRRTDLGPITFKGPSIFYVPRSPFTEGLKDLIADPRRPGDYLWCMTSGTPDNVAWTVGRMTLIHQPGHSRIIASRSVWRSPPQRWGSELPFSGCRMAVDGSQIVVAMGANRRKSASGQIVRVPLEGTGSTGVVSTGHRNPGGLAFVDGVLWEAEFGPTGGDELNVIVQGGDYGWPAVSKGEPDDGASPGAFLRSRPSSIDPVESWSPSINPAGMTTSDGKLYLALLTGAILEVRVAGTRVVSQRRILQHDERLRDVRPAGDGRLWVLEDGPAAKLMLITPKRHDRSRGR